MDNSQLKGIVIASELEAAPFISRLGLQEFIQKPFKIYAGKSLALIISGIGKANAAMATMFLNFKFFPGAIYNLGAAGALKDTFPMGGIYQIKKGTETDRPPFVDEKIPYYTPYRLKGFDEAILATQDRAVIKPRERIELSPYADLVDMEGGAVVQACKKFQTPCILFKFVSDTSEHKKPDSIIRNIEKYSDDFAAFVTESVLPQTPFPKSNNMFYSP
jgi:adenosylhomocysteine nucleosidase